MKLSLIMAIAIALGNAFEYQSPHSAGLFSYTTAAEDYSSGGIRGNPSLLPFSDGFAISGSASRPYSEEELIAGSSALQYSRYSAGFQTAWSHFGTDIYRENIYSAKFGYSPVSIISLGLSCSAYSVSIKTEEISEDINFFDYGAAATIRPFDFLDISFVQNNINSLLKNSHKETVYPERSAGILIKPDRGLSLAWNITDTSVKRINTFTAVVNPLPILSLSGGYSRETSSYGTSASLIISGFKITYTLLYHSYLGYTHSAAITFLTNTKAESMSYSKSPGFIKRDIPPININSAPYEDIVNLPGISETYAERIAAYREKIGPLSADALARIGMNNDEIRAIDEYIYGLERDRVSLRNEQARPEFTPYKKREKREDKTKRLFREMLAKGIPAGRGIEYSRLAASGEKSRFLKLLQDDTKLTELQKREIRRICGI
jgi:hypothetical protein